MDPLTIVYLLIAIGSVLLLAELLLPTGGICFFISLGLFLAAIAVSFYFGDTRTGVTTLILVFVVLPLVLMGWFWLWPEAFWGKQILPRPGEDSTVAAMPANARLEDLRGRIGTTVSPLRPSGVVDFDGRRIDCISEGMMVDAQKPVRCIDVRAGKVIVRQLDKLNLEDLESTNFG